MTVLTEFEKFWAVYPRHREKFRARTAYDKALKHVSHEKIMIAVRHYAEEVRGKELKFVKHPATWLNAGCWLDYDAVSIAAIALNMPRIFKCPECFQITIGTDCAHCRKRLTA